MIGGRDYEEVIFIFTMEILSVYEGDKYEDTCIWSIVVADGH
ncbi:hypothetical protein [Anaeromicrobium sp.]|jgi:hypothetical protein|nr:hypothetical protein [Anaeromicrobium sp.]